MQLFELRRLMAEREQCNKAWMEFVRAPSLSMGLYYLKSGEEDLQKPHTEDEVYYVVNGRAVFRAGTEQWSVEPGTLILVERSVEHRFSHITEDLTLLVFFAPPEGSRAERQVEELPKRPS
jgi:mannose-6-phosphate isomerase-like protein (cupin superfamily)